MNTKLTGVSGVQFLPDPQTAQNDHLNSDRWHSLSVMVQVKYISEVNSF